MKRAKMFFIFLRPPKAPATANKSAARSRFRAVCEALAPPGSPLLSFGASRLLREKSANGVAFGDCTAEDCLWLFGRVKCVGLREPRECWAYLEKLSSESLGDGLCEVAYDLRRECGRLGGLYALALPCCGVVCLHCLWFRFHACTLGMEGPPGFLRVRASPASVIRPPLPRGLRARPLAQPPRGRAPLGACAPPRVGG